MLQARIGELGAEISRDYAGQDLLLLAVLKGSVLFLSDLMRSITVPHSIDFMATSSLRQRDGVVRRRAHPQGPGSARSRGATC